MIRVRVKSTFAKLQKEGATEKVCDEVNHAVKSICSGVKDLLMTTITNEFSIHEIDVSFKAVELIINELLFGA